MTTIMIVEDNVQLSELYEKVLSKAGYETIQATTCHDAIELLRTNTPALILLDISLPDENGLGLMIHLKAYPRLQHTRVVVVSANNNYMEQARKAGISHFLSKPVSIPTMMEVVESLAGKPPKVPLRSQNLPDVNNYNY